MVNVKLLRPLVFVLEKFSDALMRSLGFSTKRQDTITSEDILASVGAATAAGVLAPQEEAVIQNVFDLESRLVPSAMTPRENIVFFTLDDPEEEVRVSSAKSARLWVLMSARAGSASYNAAPEAHRSLRPFRASASRKPWTGKHRASPTGYARR